MTAKNHKTFEESIKHKRDEKQRDYSNLKVQTIRELRKYTGNIKQQDVILKGVVIKSLRNEKI